MKLRSADGRRPSRRRCAGSGRRWAGRGSRCRPGSARDRRRPARPGCRPRAPARSARRSRRSAPRETLTKTPSGFSRQARARRSCRRVLGVSGARQTTTSASDMTLLQAGQLHPDRQRELLRHVRVVDQQRAVERHQQLDQPPTDVPEPDQPDRLAGQLAACGSRSRPCERRNSSPAIRRRNWAPALRSPISISASAHSATGSDEPWVVSATRMPRSAAASTSIRLAKRSPSSSPISFRRGRGVHHRAVDAAATVADHQDVDVADACCAQALGLRRGLRTGRPRRPVGCRRPRRAATPSRRPAPAGPRLAGEILLADRRRWRRAARAAAVDGSSSATLLGQARQRPRSANSRIPSSDGKSMNQSMKWLDAKVHVRPHLADPRRRACRSASRRRGRPGAAAMAPSQRLDEVGARARRGARAAGSAMRRAMARTSSSVGAISTWISSEISSVLEVPPVRAHARAHPLQLLGQAGRDWRACCSNRPAWRQIASTQASWRASPSQTGGAARAGFGRQIAVVGPE